MKYNINMKQDGSIAFGYIKRAKSIANSTNGQFQFYIDYKEVYHDKECSDEFIDLSFNLTAGSHSFLWVFYYNTNEEIIEDIQFELKYIMIMGITEAALECLSCNSNGQTGFSGVGWDHCETCKMNQYLNDNKCLDCPEDTFSYPNSIGANSCIKRNNCNDFDFKEVHSKCLNNSRTVTYEFLNPNFCNYLNYTLPSQRIEECNDICQDGFYINNETNTCTPCNNGEFSNFTTLSTNPYGCQKCSDGMNSINILNVTKFHNIPMKKDETFCKNECYSEFYSGLCEIYNNEGWKFIKDGIIPGNSLPFGIKLIMTKNIEIVSENSYFEIGYEIIDLKDEEFLFIYLDQVKVNLLSLDKGVHKYSSNLTKGEHEIKIVYQKRRAASGILNLNNPLIINSFILYGSNEGGAVQCVQNPQNPQPSTSIQIPVVTEEVKCTDFTYLNPKTNKCEVLDVLQNSKYGLRFITAGLKNSNELLCDSNSNEICYNNHKFIGPIHDIVKNDIFFMSFDKSDKISVDDFSYVRNKSFNEFGYIFGLFEHHNKTHLQRDLILNENFKIIKNLGSKISKIILSSGSPAIENTYPGFLIKYSDGDQCLSNPEISYTSYIFVICNKNANYNTPKLISKLNNNCTFIFEWENKFGCPSCLKENIESVKVNII